MLRARGGEAAGVFEDKRCGCRSRHLDQSRPGKKQRENNL